MQYLSIYCELICLLFAIALFKNLGFFKLKPFVLLLVIICITEISAANKESFGLGKNYVIYAFYFIISAPVYFWIFFNMLEFKGFIKNIYLVISGLVIVFMMMNYLFLQGNGFNTYSLIMIEFIKGILSLMVITKLFREDNYDIGIISNPYFWIAGGSLIFSIGAIVILGLQQFIYLNKIQIEGKYLYRIVIPLLNVILYSSYCYAFVLCKKLTSRLLLL